MTFCLGPTADFTENGTNSYPERVEYRESVPHPRLRPFVRCLWRLNAASVACDLGFDRIVPDGCPEIVINRADVIRRLHDDGEGHAQAAVLLVGQIRRSITLAPSGRVDLLGIRFEPGGLHALLGIPMHELLDQDFCLGQAESRLRAELEQATSTGSGIEGAVERVLAHRFEARGRVHAGLVGAAIRSVAQGAPSAEAIARELRMNRRTLERLFRAEVGLSPKLFLRIQRLQGVLERLEGGTPTTSWADLAVMHGYADQSHLIRDFRQIAGTTPERFLAERTPFASVFESGELSHSSNR